MNTSVFFGTSTLNNLPVYMDLSSDYNFASFGHLWMDEDRVLHSQVKTYTSVLELYSAINEAVRDIQVDDLMKLCNFLVTMNKTRFAADVFGFDQKIQDLMNAVSCEINKLV